MRVAVTGASGFCGSTLVQRLKLGGHDVAATDRYEPATPLPVERFVRADLLEPAALDRTFEGAEVVFHLAALPAIARTAESDYERVNDAGTALVLERALASGARRVVHVSSSTVYGVPREQPIVEDTPLAPACSYSRSKAAAERRCVEAGERDGLQVAIIRPRVVVGQGRAGIFALLFHFVQRGWPLPMPGGASNRFQFTAVEDLADGCLAAAASDRTWAGARAFNIGASTEHPLKDDLRRLVEHAGSSSRLLDVPSGLTHLGLSALHRLGIGPMVPEQLRVLTADFVLDTRRASSELDFDPKGTNVDGLLAAWDWWVDNAPSQSTGSWWGFRHQNLLQRRGEGDG